MKLNIHLPDPTPLHHLGCISLGQKKDITMYQLFGQILSMPFLFCTPCHFPFWTYFVGPKKHRSQAIEIPGGRSTKIGGRTATWPHLVSVDLDDVDVVTLLGTSKHIPTATLAVFLKMRIFRTSQGWDLPVPSRGSILFL